MQTKWPLEGIRILEMGSSVAGPYAGWILSELGAEVLKVEDPRGGDASRTWGPDNINGNSAIFEVLNRGKQSLAVDFADSQQVGALRDLIANHIDAVVQNLRPGQSERFGLGQTALLELKPALVYCDMGAYGKGGELDNLPGYDPLMQGFSGIAQATGSADSPSRVGAPLTDFATGMWAATGVLALLLRRKDTGSGGAVDTSLLESAAGFMTLFAGLFQSVGTRPQRNGLQGPLVSPNEGYRAADGLMMIVCGTDSLFGKLCAAIDRPALLKDPRFSSSRDRYINREGLKIELESVLITQPRSHWERVFGSAEVPCAPVNHVDEMMSHPQTRAVGIFGTLEGSDFQAVGLPIRLDGERPRYKCRAPWLGEHTARWLPKVSSRS